MPTTSIHWYGPGFEDANYPSSSPDHVVMFVHGWGVKWPSKGLFVDIARALSHRGITSALFDLSNFDGNGNATFLPLTDQQDRIRNVELYIRELFPSARISVIAHSMGCRVMSTLLPQMAPRLQHCVLLAPAVGTASPRLKQRMLRHPGSYELPDGSIVYKRKDGTESSISNRYLEEFNKNWDEIYKSNLTSKNYSIILAESDHREEPQEELMASLGAETLPGSDHNFTGEPRRQLVDMIAQNLSGS